MRAYRSVCPAPALPTVRSSWGFPSSRALLFLHATACRLRRTFPPSPYYLAGVLVLPSVNVQTLGVRDQKFRSCTSSSGRAGTPAAYRILCLRFAQLLFVVPSYILSLLRTERKTRYGRLARPYPAGTFTLQEAPRNWREDVVNSRVTPPGRCFAASSGSPTGGPGPGVAPQWAAEGNPFRFGRAQEGAKGTLFIRLLGFLRRARLCPCRAARVSTSSGCSST